MCSTTLIRKIAVAIASLALLGSLAVADAPVATAATPTSTSTRVTDATVRAHTYSSLPSVRVYGGTASQRARVLYLARRAGAPRGTVIRIGSNAHWGTTWLGSKYYLRSYAGVSAYHSSAKIVVRSDVARYGGSRLVYVVTHEVMHARQFLAADGSISRMWRNAGGSTVGVECVADRMSNKTANRVAWTTRGSYLTRGYARYCSSSQARHTLRASR